MFSLYQWLPHFRFRFLFFSCGGFESLRLYTTEPGHQSKSTTPFTDVSASPFQGRVSRTTHITRFRKCWAGRCDFRSGEWVTVEPGSEYIDARLGTPCVQTSFLTWPVSPYTIGLRFRLIQVHCHSPAVITSVNRRYTDKSRKGVKFGTHLHLQV